MKLLPLLLFWGLSGLTAFAGNIVGTVKAQPPPEPEGTGGAGGNYQSRRYKFVEKIDYDLLRDFVVHIDQPMGEILPQNRVPVAVTTQKDANFEPHVLPICVGTTVRWPNEDDIYHNVFSMSEVKSFDLKYYKRERVPEITFDLAGRVDVFCAIHTQMHCIILVLPNPFFALADAKGRFAIKNVPPGTYKVRAWHERFPATTQSIVVPAEGDVTANFVLGVSALPTY